MINSENHVAQGDGPVESMRTIAVQAARILELENALKIRNREFVPAGKATRERKKRQQTDRDFAEAKAEIERLKGIMSDQIQAAAQVQRRADDLEKTIAVLRRENAQLHSPTPTRNAVMELLGAKPQGHRGAV